MKTSITYSIFFCLVGRILAHAQSDTISYSDKEESSRIKIVRLNINSSWEDFNPIMSNKKLIFTSARPLSFAVVHRSDDNENNANIFYADQKDSVNFSAPQAWPDDINTFYNEGSATLSREEDLMIFSGNDRDKKNKQEKGLTLFSSKKENGKWLTPEPLWFCEEGNTYCHPALKPDGKTLFFSSNRKGTIGGMDIYYSTLTNGKWSEPQNIGTKVNTELNELFPFISSGNILYFASQRINGFGGLDIYSLDISDPIENELKLLEKPINSEHDDFGIWTDSLGGSGYFSSSRNTKRKDDIYYFNIISPEFQDAPTPSVKNTFCYTFFEESSLEEIDTTGYEYEWNLGDGTVIRGPKAKHCFKTHGTYPIQLNIVERATGAIFYNQISYDHVIPEPEQLKIETKDELVSDQKLRFSSAHSAIPGHTIERSYWMFSDGTYNYGDNVIHTFKAPGEHTITLGVIARNNTTGATEKFKLEKKITVKKLDEP